MNQKEERYCRSVLLTELNKYEAGDVTDIPPLSGEGIQLDIFGSDESDNSKVRGNPALGSLLFKERI